MSGDPDRLDDIRRDEADLDGGDFPDGTVLGDLRDYGDLGGRK